MRIQLFLLALFLAWLPLTTLQAAARGDEKTAAEETVRKYEHACEVLDFATANSLLTPDARWIEDSYPEPAQFTGEGWSRHWQEMKETKVHLRYQVRNFDTHIRGEVAWITVSLDSVATADTPEAIKANGHLREWRGTFVESYVLLREGGKWKVALGHTTLLPKTADSSGKQ
jgi:ketosteroid isomerase-like protein